MNTKSLIAKFALGLSLIAMLAFSMNALAQPTQVSITAPAADGTTVIPGGTVTFTGTATETDPNAFPLTYTWSFSDGSPNQTGQTVTYSSPANAAVGSTVTATLTVINANNVSADSTASRTVTVVAAPRTVTGPLIYVTNLASNTVGLIDTTSNNLVATLSVNHFPFGQAVSQNRKYAYILYPQDGTPKGIISVIDPVTHTVTAKVDVDTGPYGVDVTPDGTLSYATIFDSYGTVTVTNTSTNLVIATIPVGSYPVGISITPDGKSAYVANFADATVSVIDIASNTVTNTINVGFNPFRVGNVLSTPATPFKDFNVENLLINPYFGAFTLSTTFNLGDASVGIAPSLQQTVLSMDKFFLMIPSGAFANDGGGNYQFSGMFKGLYVNVLLRQLSGKHYSLDVYAYHSNLIHPKTPLTVKLTIGGEYGSAVWPMPK
jgi:YVTN family beta-propeller protein